MGRVAVPLRTPPLHGTSVFGLGCGHAVVLRVAFIPVGDAVSMRWPCGGHAVAIACGGVAPCDGRRSPIWFFNGEVPGLPVTDAARCVFFSTRSAHVFGIQSAGCFEMVVRCARGAAALSLWKRERVQGLL